MVVDLLRKLPMVVDLLRKLPMVVELPLTILTTPGLLPNKNLLITIVTTVLTSPLEKHHHINQLTPVITSLLNKLLSKAVVH